MKYFECSMCSFVARGRTAPGTCPVCGAPRSSFEEVPGGVRAMARFPRTLWWLMHVVGMTAVYALGVFAGSWLG